MFPFRFEHKIYHLLNRFSNQLSFEQNCDIDYADSMSVWNLLREFRIRKVHMAVVLNEYGGTVGVCIIFICYYLKKKV